MTEPGDDDPCLRCDHPYRAPPNRAHTHAPKGAPIPGCWWCEGDKPCPAYVAVPPGLARLRRATSWFGMAAAGTGAATVLLVLGAPAAPGILPAAFAMFALFLFGGTGYLVLRVNDVFAVRRLSAGVGP